MQCPRCQQVNRQGRRFCSECGASLALTCPSCSFSNEPGEKFCGGCGQPISTAQSSAQFASPQSYTPKHLAEKILTSKAALEGERKHVTVLFADLKGSMELLADRDPEDARKLLDPVLEHMMEAVHRYEGTVNQVMGDGIMALFGAPLAHEDHAVRACYAALRMQEAIENYAKDLSRNAGVRVQIRVGINSGEVVVRSIGSDLRMDYSAVGQTTHLAARMEQMAMPGSIILTPATLALAEDFIQVRSMGPTPVKGLSEAIDVCELMGAKAVRSRFHAHVTRGLSKLVGRTSEMRQLAEALDLVRSNHGQVVAVVGDPGVGKSRLFWEFVHSHGIGGYLIVESAAVSYGKATPYLPVIEMLRDYFQIEPRDDIRKIREKVAGKLSSLDGALESTLPALFGLLDIPVDDEQWSRLDPQLRRQRTLDAVKRLLLRESEIQPLIVVFEDLHWIDTETQAVLNALVEGLPTYRLLLLANYRPEYQHPWGGKTYYRQVRVDALQSASAEEFLYTLLGNNVTLEPLKRLLIERTDGNPFFLEESVRTLVETKVLAGDPSRYWLTRSPESLQIPATAQAILASRIDRLEPRDKELLQAASVIGKGASLTLLEAIADMSADELGQRLVRLQVAEFLYETRLFPDVEHSFKHALTHEVAYGSLLLDRRRRLHARIVDAIERLHEGRLTEHIEHLAHHAARSEVWDKAARYGYDAGRRSLERSAYREATAYLEQALAATAQPPAQRDALERSIDIRIALRTTLLALGEGSRAFEHVREAEAIARGIGDDVQLLRVTLVMFHHLWLAGRTKEARKYGERTVALAESHGGITLRIAANVTVGQSEVWWGEWAKAEGRLHLVMDLLQGDHTRTHLGAAVFPAVMACSNLAAVHAHRGEFREGVRIGEEAVRIATSLRHPFSVVYAMAHLGLVYLYQGDLPKVTRQCELGLTAGAEAAIGFLAQFLAAVRGYVQILSGGSIDVGLPPLQRAIEVQTVMGFRYGLGWLVEMLSESLLLAGRPDEAAEQARRGMSLAVECGERWIEAECHRTLGDIATLRESASSEPAEQHYRDALTLASELGARPLAAHCHLGLGKLYRRTGSRQEAQEHLDVAVAMYREMGMTYWLEKVEAELT